MRVIKLNKGKALELPQAWEELTRPQIEFVFELLIQLFEHKITPFQFQLLLLFKITGYRPARISAFQKFITWLWVIVKKDKDALDELKSLKYEIQENIHFNLIKLAECLDFIFKVEENKIIPSFDFKKNPFDYLSEIPPEFSRNYVVETNLTAKQFTDALDLVVAMDQTDDNVAQAVFLDRLIQVLYFENIQLDKISPTVKFGILCWFRSVVLFFKNHPVFSILYRKSETDDADDKISLGMTEIILYLKKTGYSDSAEMNLIDFFNAQIKSLKDTIAHALASGVKEEELSQKTGLDPYIIHKLS